jgi:hypothetical protein
VARLQKTNKLYKLKNITFIGFIILTISCNGYFNKFISKSEDNFNPELTELYNTILVKKNSESRILAMTHYYLTSQTIEILDSIIEKSRILNCQNDKNNCFYNYLNENSKYNLLNIDLLTTKNNFLGMTTNMEIKKQVERNFENFNELENKDWLTKNFKNLEIDIAINKIEKFKDLINKSSIIIMKEIISKSYINLNET